MDLNVDMELLSVQKMHPDIAEFSNKQFYDGKLKSDYNYKFDIKPLEIIHVDGNEEKIGNSFSNKIEVQKVIEIFNKFNSIFKDIVIIAPYQAQCDLLRKMNNNLNVHTLDSFQGREADMIILCTVRSTTLGFWDDERRLNVGLTRAKHVLRVIGNTNVWTSGPLKKFIQFYNSI